ncbi:MAG TPA: Zn-dependent hydrolase [Tepidisphaeraceae bacterium]|nr:Zn-dependent hydrolase [Tepidisphaeraceae bacterium]
MPINVDRIWRDIEAIAGFNETTPSVGYSRPTFSPAWRQARDYVIAQAEATGCQTRIDAAGNVHARPRDLPSDAPAWLSGSHIDSVPTGGKYDGVAGVVAPLEILRAAREDAKPIALELIIFAEEEGTTFGLGMLGSRAWVGELTADDLAKVRSTSGQNYLEAGREHGVRPDDLPRERFNRSAYIGLVEIHIEQGPDLWNLRSPIAIVSSIAGRRQYRVAFHGVANHAGATSMRTRKDALAAAAPIIIQVEAMARDLSPQTVATVGRIDCRPNAINVIPERVDFTIDLRSPNDALLAEGHERITKYVMQSAERREMRCELTMTEDQPAMQLDQTICARLKRAAGEVSMAVSGALHDAAILAPQVPTAMIFVASKDGISHNPEEFSRVEDIAAAATVLQNGISGEPSP